MQKLIHDFAPGAGNARNSEGAFLKRKDGKILFFYSKFGNSGHDFGTASIVSTVFSEDGNEFLGEERVLFTPEDFKADNLMCPSVLRLQNGQVLLFFLVRFGPVLDLVCYRSDDDCETFYDMHWAIKGDRYLVVENDRVIQLKNGRILLQAGWHLKQEGGYAGITDKSHFLATFWSDDNGATFLEGKLVPATPESGNPGMQEPGVVELDDGRVFSFVRNGSGYQLSAISEDSGETFSDYKPNHYFPSPVSPMSIKKLADGRLLAVLNPVSTPAMIPGLGSNRNPFGYILSSDDGATWSQPVIIESQPDSAYCYTAIYVEKDFVLLGYNAGCVADHGCLNRLRVTRFDVKDLK